MTTQHLSTLVLAVVFCGSFHTAHGERPIFRPELLAGPWEFTGPSGIEGIFLSIDTHAQGTADQPIVNGQTVQIRVYHRHGGRETWGWYVAHPSGPADSAAVFDGQHLRIRRVRNGPALDLTFHAETQRWTGTWSREGPRAIVLERPRFRVDAAPNPFRGEWEGIPGPGGAQTRLHIDQSLDGTLTVWMDRSFGLGDQRHGELLQLVSVEQRTITFETTNAICCPSRFHGTLSADRSTLAGRWNGQGGNLNASESFLRR
jgi:hypothetical protein